MKYYNYKEVKNITKGTNLIVLLTIMKGEYIGLAQQDKSYKIKPKYNYNLIDQYDFIVCYKVLGAKEEYLVPIGYSDEDQWVEQEEDYKQNLILKDSESDEEKILNICKNIKKENGELYWENIAEMIGDKFQDIEDVKDSAFSNLMMYKIIKRCYQEKFPIEEYILFEIPYGDENCWIMNFVHGEDFDDYHVKKLKHTKIRGIDFVVEKDGEAIPHSYNPKTHKQYAAVNCESAVWTD